MLDVPLTLSGFCRVILAEGAYLPFVANVVVVVVKVVVLLKDTSFEVTELEVLFHDLDT